MAAKDNLFFPIMIIIITPFISKARARTQHLLDEIIGMFDEFLDIHKDVVLVNAAKPRSNNIRRLKEILSEKAERLKVSDTLLV